MVAAPKQVLELVSQQVFRVRQIKHYLDIDKLAWWKVCFFYSFYRPLVLFVYHVLKIPVLMRIDEAGNPCWEEDQGTYTDEGVAEELIAGKKWWSYKSSYLDVALPSTTCTSGKCVDGGNGDSGHVRRRVPWESEQTPKRDVDQVERAIVRLETTLGGDT